MNDHRTEALTATRELLRTGLAAVERMTRRRLRTAGTTPTVGGALTEGLYGIHASGVSTTEIVRGGRELLASLGQEMRARTLADVPHETWSRWSRAHDHHRTGLAVPDLGIAARHAALELIDAAVSIRLLGDTPEIARLHRLAACTLDEGALDYGRVTVLGAPSPTAPWGWQVRGRHVTVSCFLLADQLILIPVSARLTAVRDSFTALPRRMAA
ncbi:hypothetical protein Pen01_44390 [Phytomonospora endophytica]|nr:hypothetical protein Pen01_44390 [Phytomonospora endophytica]